MNRNIHALRANTRTFFHLLELHMSQDPKSPDVPDLAVIDRAIHAIAAGHQRWSCWALAFAIPNARPDLANRYCAQFKAWTRHEGGGSLPDWWTEGDNTPENAAKRVAALMSFRQALVNAAAFNA
jgi:hypothetical protein